MLRKLSLSVLTLGFLVLASCAHHRDVRAGADGVHRILVTNEDKEGGARDAISQANHFCEQRGLSAAFINEDAKYTGSMDEKNYKTAKTASKAAQIIGGTVYGLGGTKESPIGGLVGLGGAVADSALGKGYSVEMKFKCL